MTYKSLTITIIVFLLVGAGLGYVLFRPKSAPAPVEESNPSQDFFPVSKVGDATAPQKTKVGSGTGEVATSTLEGLTHTTASSTREGVARTPTLRLLVSIPTSGATILDRKKQTVVRYLERETGHIQEIALDEKVPTRVTNDTLTKSFRVWWGAAGESLLIERFADKVNSVETLFTQITHPKATSTGIIGQASYVPTYSSTVGTVETTLLPPSLAEIALSPDRKKVFYLVHANDGILGIVTDLLQSAAIRQAPIFQSSFTEWLPEWAGENLITLTTRASASVPGYLYFLNPSTRAFTKILTDIPGLTTRTDPSGKHILYSSSPRVGLETHLYDVVRHASSAFPVQTLPEKCVFSTHEAVVYCAVPEQIPVASYPDAWYKGVVQFSDSMWKIDLETSAATLLVQPTTIRKDQVIDAIDLELSAGDTSLIFRNKKDGSVWLLTL